ncbi:MAG TPA: glycosyltransferase family 39 protein [Bryobacteraceae bacterium]|nr:glycosyltransferase family 39 protein [Bryobacteraceae bacterium]
MPSEDKQFPAAPTLPKARFQLCALEYVTVCTFLWIVAAVLQWKAGAFAVELSGNPDESAHYITGLMIRDYIASGNFTRPMTYAEHYYAHYPKVAFGMWPPFFHIVEALWMLIFSPGKVSVLSLMALITAATGTSIYYVLRRKYGWQVSFASGALFVLSPLVQASTSAVMVDGLVALLDLWATIYLVRYLEGERTRAAVVFGVLAALSMATKANGVALALLPILAIAFTRRWHLLRVRGLYYAAAIVLVFGLPWPVLSYWLIERSLGGEAVTVSLIAGTALAYVRVLWAALGWGLSLFCIIGAVWFLVRLFRNDIDFALAGALALMLSVWAYHSSIGNGADRYMVAALPPALILAAAGFDWAARRMPPHALPLRARAVALGALAIGFFAIQTWAVPLKPYQGFDQPAHFLLTTPEFAAGNFLVISNARGEGAFIAEVAMHDHRPGHLVLRSTKVMSSSNWYGSVYHLRYTSSKEICDFLDRAPIDAVLLDTRPAQVWVEESAFQLETRVGEALKSDPNWKLRDRFPRLRDTAPWIDLYSRLGPQPTGSVKLDLSYTLGKDIVATDGKEGK